MTHLAVDLGTTNTVLAVWREGKAEVIDLPGLTVRRGPQRAPLVPSVVCLADGRGQRMAVGQAATEIEGNTCLRSFKPYLLSRDPARPVRKVQGRALSGIEIAALFLQGVLRALRLHHGNLAETLHSVTAPAPVEAFEPYRAALQRNLDHGLGSLPFHSLDEPLAAALGYGLGLHRERIVLVVDFGGGTLDMAVVRLGPDPKREAGRVTTLAKQGLSLGGDDLDLWLAQEMAAQSGQRWEDLRPWHGRLKEAAEAAKIALSTHLQTTFPVPEAGIEIPISRSRFEDLLQRRGVYTRLQEVLEATLGQAAGRGVAESNIESVLLVGGSTLLPSVQRLFIETFGRTRVRGDRPFGAVALGAARFAGGVQARDFIQHSYALRVYDAEKGAADYEILIPAGTPYPTPPDFVVREYPARCPGGRPVDRFHLRIYEVGVRDESARSELIQLPDGSWDWATPEEAGRREPVVCLNDENPTLGRLDPSQTPDAPQPRLRIAFSVDADRYLRATVHDLHRSALLIEAHRVVQLR